MSHAKWVRKFPEKDFHDPTLGRFQNYFAENKSKNDLFIFPWNWSDGSPNRGSAESVDPRTRLKFNPINQSCKIVLKKNCVVLWNCDPTQKWICVVLWNCDDHNFTNFENCEIVLHNLWCLWNCDLLILNFENLSKTWVLQWMDLKKAIIRFQKVIFLV